MPRFQKHMLHLEQGKWEKQQVDKMPVVLYKQGVSVSAMNTSSLKEQNEESGSGKRHIKLRVIKK